MEKTRYEKLMDKADYCISTAITRTNISDWARNWMRDVSNKLRVIAGNLPATKEHADAILNQIEEYR